ncbi:hypothetical protein [Streptomyces rubradiris]|uniref:Secreted protein n=1 Tax=Streptomyces rubradiris TaxID=285531 RepID=A0ABQ3RPA4_STRRR|nr:hypothetical protein [Streptomyces rubradiris]GHH12000.1 hypothetical protein GCM10018792_36950 [Streptomyces rubradiris]GHI57678.1 hypothetical protein Srubr_75240 [Streptomyces rubradiris]
MTEIIAAIVGGVFALGAAVITVRWTRSRSVGGPATTRANSSGDTGPDSPTPTAPQAINAGQYIQTNNGTVSQTNYRDGKQ